MEAKDKPDEYIESGSVRVLTFAAATFNLTHTDEMCIGMTAEIELLLEISRMSRYVFQNHTVGTCCPLAIVPLAKGKGIERDREREPAVWLLSGLNMDEEKMQSFKRSRDPTPYSNFTIRKRRDFTQKNGRTTLIAIFKRIPLL